MINKKSVHGWDTNIVFQIRGLRVNPLYFFCATLEYNIVAETVHRHNIKGTGVDISRHPAGG